MFYLRVCAIIRCFRSAAVPRKAAGRRAVPDASGKLPGNKSGGQKHLKHEISYQIYDPQKPIKENLPCLIRWISRAERLLSQQMNLTTQQVRSDILALQDSWNLIVWMNKPEFIFHRSPVFINQFDISENIKPFTFIRGLQYPHFP